MIRIARFNDMNTMESHGSIPNPDQPTPPRLAMAGTKRRFGRLPQESLQSNLGLVLDLSAGGMRILARSKVKGSVQVILKGYPLPGPLLAQVTWVKRAGLFMHEVGLRFANLTPEMSQSLTQIGSIHRYRRAM